MGGCGRGLPCDPGSTLLPVRGTPFNLAHKMWLSAHHTVLAGHTPRAGDRVREDVMQRVNGSLGPGGARAGQLGPLGKVKPGMELGVALPPRAVLGAMKVMRAGRLTLSHHHQPPLHSISLTLSHHSRYPALRCVAQVRQLKRERE